MPCSVKREEILRVAADAAVISVENAMLVSVGASNEALAAAGGDTLLQTLRRRRFLPVGSCCAEEPCGLPFTQLLVTSAPRWWNGECNELLVLRRCYEGLFRLAQELGCRSLVTPFLSTAYFHFPPEDAVGIALAEAEKTALEVIFCAETPELFALGRTARRKPQIVGYVGWYRDHAVFRLDNGMFVRVDMRPERRDAELRSFIDACYYAENNPYQQPLPEEEIARLRAIYESDGN